MRHPIPTRKLLLTGICRVLSRFEVDGGSERARGEGRDEERGEEKERGEHRMILSESRGREEEKRGKGREGKVAVKGQEEQKGRDCF